MDPPKGSGCADANLDLEVDGAVAKAVGCPKAGGVPGGFVEEHARGADPCMHGAVGLHTFQRVRRPARATISTSSGAEWFQSTMRVLVISPTMSGWSASRASPWSFVGCVDPSHRDDAVDVEIDGHRSMDGVAVVVDHVGVFVDPAFGGSHAESASASAVSGTVVNGSRSSPFHPGRAVRRSTTAVSTLPVNGL